MADKNHSQQLYEANCKIMKWTCRCENAKTRKAALKALRKIAKFSRKLAALQGRLYAYENTEELL